MGAFITIVLVVLAVMRFLKTPADDYHLDRNCTFVGFCNFGHGTLECFNPHEVYSGNWWLGKRSGCGMQINEKGLYQGEWKMNEMHGLGFMLLTNGTTFEIGMFENGTMVADWSHNKTSFANATTHNTDDMCQFVTLTCPDARLKHGFGTLNFTNSPYFYKGHWENDKRNGMGVSVSTDGTYEGMWRDDQKHGRGKHILIDGSVFTGDFAHNQRNGLGELVLRSGDVYRGEFKNGLFHGYGELKTTNGSTVQGDWERGKKSGRVVETTKYGIVNDCEWKNGVREHCTHDGNDLFRMLSSFILALVWIIFGCIWICCCRFPPLP